MADGRSSPPAPPVEIEDLLIVRAINVTLGTNLLPVDLDSFPVDEIERLVLVCNALNDTEGESSFRGK